MKRALDWVPVALGIALLATLAGLQWRRISHGQTDFVQLYIGAKLAGSPDLYSRAANQAMIKSILGAAREPLIHAIILSNKKAARLIERPFSSDLLLCLVAERSHGFCFVGERLGLRRHDHLHQVGWRRLFL
jgi:hypothetical protein